MTNSTITDVLGSKSNLGTSGLKAIVFATMCDWSLACNVASPHSIT
jgi:hypothetical protein